MAIVPQFQGGTPQVRDSGGTGFTPVQAPQNNYDYGKVLKEAMRPVEDFSKSFSEALRINHVRTVKAESDDAERQAVDVINTYLSDPENGYLAKSGKNAMDGYGATVEGMQNDISKIVGALSPQTREAVNSRIQDRLTAAVGQARSWYTKQTQSYHLKSSQDKVDMLVRDYAEHYGDQTYRAKTWNALQTEIDYQVNLLGLPKESAAKYKTEYFNQAQAMRFTLMADDSPVDALSAFRQESDSISPDVRAKLGHQLFARAKSELGVIAYSQIGKQIVDKKDFLREAVRPGFKTGIDLIDSLPKDQRIQVLSDAYSQAAQARSEAQIELRRQVADSIAVTQDTGVDENGLDRDAFIAAFGEKEGARRFDAYAADIQTANAMYQMRGLTNDGMQAIVDCEKPIPGQPDYAEQKKRYESAQRAALNVMKARSEDPVAMAVQTHAYGFETLNIGNTDELTKQLAVRSAEMKTMAMGWGTTPSIFSKAEIRTLTDALDKSTPAQQAELLGVIANAVGADGIAVAGRQLNGENERYAIAMTGMGISNGEGTSAGALYLKGVEAADRGLVKMSSPEANVMRTTLYEQILASNDGKVAGLYATKQAQDTVVERAMGIWAAKKAIGTDLKAKDALALAVGGNVVVRNGRTIIAPRGVDDKSSIGVDMFDIVDAQAELIRQGGGTYYIGGGMAVNGDELASRLSRLALTVKDVSGDTVTYGVVWGGDPILGSDKREYTFTASAKLPDEVKAKYRKVDSQDEPVSLILTGD